MSTSYSVPPSASLAMTGQYPPQTYRGLQDVNRAIATLEERFRQRDDASQYLFYKHVSVEDFSFLEESRDQLRGAVRFTYFPDIETLIIKVPTIETEIGHRGFDRMISLQLATNMGISFSEFMPLGATRYVGSTASQKEGDSAFKNRLLRPHQADWPHFVIEAGVSESLPRLRQDAAWWIGNSGGQVLLVLLLKVSRTERTITIEKYYPQQRGCPNLRTASPNFIPELISTTVVNLGSSPPAVHGAPVVLEFSRVIGRQPDPPEQDVILPPAVLIEIGIAVFDD